MAQIKADTNLSDESKKGLLGFLTDEVDKWYKLELEKALTRAFVGSYEEQAEVLFQSYLTHASASISRTKVRDEITGEETEADESLLKFLEEQIGIVGTNAVSFRSEVLSFCFSLTKRKQALSFRSYEPLKEAIEKHLLLAAQKLVPVITKAKTMDKEQQEKYETMVTNLLANGYCQHCVEVILRYAAAHLWK